MSEPPPKAAWKLWVILALLVLVMADIALAVFLSQSGTHSEMAMRTERDRLAMTAKLLNADVRRADKIRASLPQVGKDCTKFYEKTFPSADVGYSSIESDLDSIASHAGLRTSGVSFKPTELKDRGVTQLEITAELNGDYASIIRFINGLEVSKNFYLLNDLSLDSASTGGIRLQLKLHTYFRT
ncbi:MAG TPA: GspMb/PilO family protein [Candidatus Acidoferrales bacterium]|nr:GspMb/PilO family protein [Candidatus Acidoferrales bacterium]